MKKESIEDYTEWAKYTHPSLKPYYTVGVPSTATVEWTGSPMPLSTGGIVSGSYAGYPAYGGGTVLLPDLLEKVTYQTNITAKYEEDYFSGVYIVKLMHTDEHGTIETYRFDISTVYTNDDLRDMVLDNYNYFTQHLDRLGKKYKTLDLIKSGEIKSNKKKQTSAELEDRILAYKKIAKYGIF